MNSLRYEQTTAIPLETDSAIECRVLGLIGAPVHDQLWVLFLDDAQYQRELIIPIDDLVVLLDPNAMDYLFESLSEITAMQGGGSIILVRERVGSAMLTSLDALWAESLTDACRRNGTPVRAILLCSDEGVSHLCAVPVA
jgi:hypothetical protein